MAQSSLQLKDHWQEQRLFLSRIIAAGVVVLLLAGALVARLVQLQIIENERFVELSQGNRFRIDPLPPTRGIIYDRHGNVIAENRPNWELVATAEQIENLFDCRVNVDGDVLVFALSRESEQLARELSGALGRLFDYVGRLVNLRVLGLPGLEEV